MRRPNGMPLTGGLMGRKTPRLVAAQLTSAYELGGRHYVDAHHPDSINGWTQVPVVELGGGLARFMHVPLAGDQGEDKPAFQPAEETDPSDIASAQVWLMFDGVSTNPICIGAVQHPKRGLVTETPETEDGQDRPAEIGVNDIAAANGDASHVIDALGVVAVQPAEGQIWNLKLRGTSRARISRDGDADERLLLGNAALQALQDAHDWIDALQSRIDELERVVATLATWATGGGSTTLGALSLVPPFTPPSSSAPSRPDATLVSDAVHISDDNEGP
jgi:hypothetical protein